MRKFLFFLFFSAVAAHAAEPERITVEEIARLKPMPGKALIVIFRPMDSMLNAPEITFGKKVLWEMGNENLLVLQTDENVKDLKVRQGGGMVTLSPIPVDSRRDEVSFYLQDVSPTGYSSGNVGQYRAEFRKITLDFFQNKYKGKKKKFKCAFFNLEVQGEGKEADHLAAKVSKEDLASGSISHLEPAPAAAEKKAGVADRIDNPTGIAVIIGNRNYSAHNRDLPDVTYAHNDADAVHHYVTRKLGFREGNIIFLKDASQAQMLSVFGSATNYRGKLYNWLKPGESDVFIFYSGHGTPGTSSGRGYLLPVDADPITVEINGYPLDTLYQNLAKLPARSMTVAMDACFSGASDGGAVFRNASSITLRVQEVRPAIPKATVMTASGPDEVASWDAKNRLGLFTRFLLEGLEGKADQTAGNKDGKVTVRELRAYLDEEVTYWARRQFGRNQHPQVFGEEETILAAP